MENQEQAQIMKEIWIVQVFLEWIFLNGMKNKFDRSQSEA